MFIVSLNDKSVYLGSYFKDQFVQREESTLPNTCTNITWSNKESSGFSLQINRNTSVSNGFTFTWWNIPCTFPTAAYFLRQNLLRTNTRLLRRSDSGNKLSLSEIFWCFADASKTTLTFTSDENSDFWSC